MQELSKAVYPEESCEAECDLWKLCVQLFPKLDENVRDCLLIIQLHLYYKYAVSFDNIHVVL